MKRLLRDHGLSLVLFGLFLSLLAFGQFYCGWQEYNGERSDRGLAPVDARGYLKSPHFLEATTENWESEFLQMFAYILFTVALYQRGSAESKDPDKSEPPPRPVAPDSPWPVRRGGWWRRLYAHSLSLAFLGLFLVAFGLHAWSGARLQAEEEAAGAVSTWSYLATTRFWFESFQNWQSEFLAIGSMVVLSIFLRERGSPESKPVEMPHAENE